MDKLSSDSDQFLQKDQVQLSCKPSKSVVSKVDQLASTLQGTNRNLRFVDQMLEEYQQLGEKQTNTIDQLKDDLAQTSAELREERLRHFVRDTKQPLPSHGLVDDEIRGQKSYWKSTWSLRDDESDREYDRHRRRQSRRGVRFYDDMDAPGHLHSGHQTLLDLARQQSYFQNSINCDKRRTQRSHSDNSRHLGQGVDVRTAQVSSAINSVDKRLQNIQAELRSDRDMFKKKNDEIGKISSELKEALLQSASSNKECVFKPSQAAPQITEIHRATTGQLEGLGHQLCMADKDQTRLRGLLDQLEDNVRKERRHQAYEDQSYKQILLDKHQLEEELQELKNQLTKCAVVVGDFGAIRRELENSEKQRNQLSDHIQVLNKDMENKEKQNTKLLVQFQEICNKFEETDHEKHSIVLQLKDTLQKLCDSKKHAERLGADLKDAQHGLQESEHKRELMKARAQETVQQWKMKCKKLERDVDHHQQSVQQGTEQKELLLKKIETLQNQVNIGAGQLEHLKREISDLLATRAQQDEQIRLKGVEVSELKSLKADLETDVSQSKMTIEKLTNELLVSNEKLHRMYEEKSSLEEEVSSLSTGKALFQAQISQLQLELRELGISRVEMSAQLAECAQEKHDLKITLADVRQEETMAREDAEILKRRLTDEKTLYGTRLEAVKNEMEYIKGFETQVTQEMFRRLKKEQAEYEAELKALKIELQEERSANRMSKAEQEKLKLEVDRLHTELVRSQEDVEETTRKYHKVKEELFSKSQFTEDGLSNLRKVELELLEMQESNKRQQKGFESLLYSIGAEVDSAVEAASMDSINTYTVVSSTQVFPSEPQKWLAEIKGKMSWLRNEIKEKQRSENRMWTSCPDVVESSEKNQDTLMSTSFTPHDYLHHFSCQEKGPPEKDIGNVEEESLLKGTFNDSLECEAATGLHVSTLDSDPCLTEREEIHKRYSRLQEAVTSLKSELSDNQKDHISPTILQHPAGLYKPSMLTSNPPTREPAAPSSLFHVDSPTEHAPTPPPLDLSDQEFTDKYLPKIVEEVDSVITSSYLPLTSQDIL